MPFEQIYHLHIYICMLFFTGLCASHEIFLWKNLKSGGVRMTIAGKAVNDKTARVAAGDKVENEGYE